MPEYVKKVLDRLQQTKPKRPQYASHRWTVPDYGKYSKWNQIQNIALFLTRKPPKYYIILWEPFYILPGRLFQRCYKRLMKYHKYDQSQQGTLSKKQECY